MVGVGKGVGKVGVGPSVMIDHLRPYHAPLRLVEANPHHGHTQQLSHREIHIPLSPYYPFPYLSFQTQRIHYAVYHS
jgi:hypothetical protein